MEIFESEKMILVQISKNDIKRLCTMAEAYDYKEEHRDDVSRFAEEVIIALKKHS